MKKGAVAGAIVWSAPLLTSTPAFAATAECGGGSQECSTWYYAKVEVDDNNRNARTCSGGGTGDGAGSGCPVPPIGCPSGSKTTFENGCSLLPAATFTHTGSSATVTFPEGAIPLYIQIKPGSNCYTYKWNGTDFVFYSGTNGTPTPPPPGCLGGIVDSVVNGKIKVDVTWNQGGSGCNGISHFNVYFCL